MRILLTLVSSLCIFNISYSQGDESAELSRRVPENPPDFAAVQKLIEIFIEQRNFASADSVLKKFIEREGENAHALYLEARILDLTDNIEAALAGYKKAIDLDSTLWQAYRDLAFLYDIFSEYDTMNHLLSRVMEYAPVPESLYYDYGYTFDMLGQFDSAEYYYRQAIDFDSLDHQAYLNLGAIIAMGGNLDSAKVLSQKAIDIDSESPEAFFNLGEISLSLGLFDQAAESFQGALALDPGLFAAKKRLGDLYEIMGDSAMARIYYQEFLKEAPIMYIDDINEIRNKLNKSK